VHTENRFCYRSRTYCGRFSFNIRVPAHQYSDTFKNSKTVELEKCTIFLHQAMTLVAWQKSVSENDTQKCWHHLVLHQKFQWRSLKTLHTWFYIFIYFNMNHSEVKLRKSMKKQRRKNTKKRMITMFISIHWWKNKRFICVGLCPVSWGDTNNPPFMGNTVKKAIIQVYMLSKHFHAYIYEKVFERVQVWFNIVSWFSWKGGISTIGGWINAGGVLAFKQIQIGV